MKMFIISDNADSRVGMRLAGVEGVTVSGREEFSDALYRAAEDKNIAVIMVTYGLIKTAGDIIDEFKLSRNTPIVIEVPDSNSIGKNRDSITRYVRESIGLNI